MDRDTYPWAAPGTLPAYREGHGQQLVSAAEQRMASVAATVLRDRMDSLRAGRDRDGRQFFVMEEGPGQHSTIWVDAIPLESGRLADTATNTTSQNYVIRITDRLPDSMLDRVLAHELGELNAVRERAADGLTPVRDDLLRSGPVLPSESELSAADMGRIAELDWLAARHSDPGLSTEEQAFARSEFSALLDSYGLRPTAALDDQTHLPEQNAAAHRHLVAASSVSLASERLLRDLARPIEHLSPADATALAASREASLRAQRQVEAFVAGREVTMALPGYDQNGLPLPRDGLGKAAAQEWAAWREHRSGQATQMLGEQNAAGETPHRRVRIGGGASLSGRGPEELLIDAVGRWHDDPGAGIVQSADQDRDLAHWMGADPYAVVSDPRDRVPIKAVRVWEDRLATQGDVVNGHGQLRLGPDGQLITEIQPASGGAPLRVSCDGIPVVATGLTPEVVPGMPRGRNGVESRAEAVRLLGDRLRELDGQGVPGAADWSRWLTDAERGGADAAAVLGPLEAGAVKDLLRKGLEGDAAARLDNCFTILEATRTWEDARAQAPGRVLMGDEVAENRFDPNAAEHWVIVGSGGTGAANAEIILRKNQQARVTLVGRGDPPPALRHQVQFGAMEEKYGQENGDGRLEFGKAEVGAVEPVVGEDGRTRLRMTYTVGEETKTVDADGYVACLGRTNPLPAAVQGLADDVRDRGGEVSGDLLFDRDDQFLGYRLGFAVDGTVHHVDVDGAAAWQLPREVFPPEQGLQGDLNRMGVRALPSETGNAAPGFAPVARQSALRARAVEQEREGDAAAVQALPSVPDRWKRPAVPRPSPAAEAPAPAVVARDEPAVEPAAKPSVEAPAAGRTPPDRGPAGSHLWTMGAPTLRPVRPGPGSGPSRGQQSPPPEAGPRGPGPGLGD
ncbi:hypothetical protein ACIPW5_14495 [Streptomyces sp. NPDC090077]|uniref:hypothetical protein n=1 Tax=Streptomyces sp. NPDC090077 TaxID=3365938 RepID=UPI0038041570